MKAGFLLLSIVDSWVRKGVWSAFQMGGGKEL